MHLLLLAFFLCVLHYGLVRGTGHFIWGFIKGVALAGAVIFGLLLLIAIIVHH